MQKCRSSLHERMRDISAQRTQQHSDVGHTQKFLVVVRRQLLLTRQNGGEWNSGGSLKHFLGSFAEFIPQSTVSIPHGEQVMQTEHGGGRSGKGGTDVGRVCRAPHQLPDHLRVSGDSDDAGLPQMQLRLLHCSNLRML